MSLIISLPVSTCSLRRKYLISGFLAFIGKISFNEYFISCQTNIPTFPLAPIKPAECRQPDILFCLIVTPNMMSCNFRVCWSFTAVRIVWRSGSVTYEIKINKNLYIEQNCSYSIHCLLSNIGGARLEHVKLPFKGNGGLDALFYGSLTWSSVVSTGRLINLDQLAVKVWPGESGTNCIFGSLWIIQEA